MISTLYHELFASAESLEKSENRSKGAQQRLGDQLDEIAVFALVAFAVIYIAAASYWFIF